MKKVFQIIFTIYLTLSTQFSASISEENSTTYSHLSPHLRYLNDEESAEVKLACERLDKMVSFYEKLNLDKKITLADFASTITKLAKPNFENKLDKTKIIEIIDSIFEIRFEKMKILKNKPFVDILHNVIHVKKIQLDLRAFFRRLSNFEESSLSNPSFTYAINHLLGESITEYRLFEIFTELEKLQIRTFPVISEEIIPEDPS